MGLVRIPPDTVEALRQGPDTEQVLATVSFKLDTRFNEYISKASPEQRRLLRSLRSELFRDLTWLLERCAGVDTPMKRCFEGSSKPG